MLPPGPELADVNRRIIAERASWPANALADCEWIDRHHPGWCTWWLEENPIRGFEAPTGYYSTHEQGYAARSRSVYGADIAAVVYAINVRQEQLDSAAAENERWRMSFLRRAWA